MQNCLKYVILAKLDKSLVIILSHLRIRNHLITLLFNFQAVANALASEASIANLYYAVFASLADPAKKLDGPATLKTLLAALKKDDSLPNLGFAFQVQ